MITIIFGRAAQFLLALAMVRVATTLLTPEEMGRVSLVLTTIAFFALFLINPVGMFINRRLHAWRASGVAKHYLLRYVSYLLLVAFITALGLPLLYMIRMVDFGLSLGWLIFLVCGSLLFNTINQTAIPSLNMLGDSGRFVLLSVATIAASFACAVLLVEWMHPSAQYWLLGLLLGQTILAVIGAGVLFSRLQNSPQQQVRPTIRKRHLKTLYSFAWPVAIAAGLGWVQGQGYRYLMESQLGLVQLGLFVAGYGISAGVIAGFESVVTTYFQPRLYRSSSSDNPKEWKEAWQQYARAVIPSLMLTSALIIILAPELTTILLGENFKSASQYVIWGAIAETIRLMTSTYSLVAHIHMRTKWLILPNLIGSMVSIGLCVALIPTYGGEGVGISLAIAAFAGLLFFRVLLGENAQGGISWAATCQALIFASVLMVIATLLRNLLEQKSLVVAAGTLVFVGTTYLGFQFFLLKSSISKIKTGS